MKKLALLAAVSALAFGLPSAANAGACVGGSELDPSVGGALVGTVSCFYPGDTEFTTSPAGATTGIISATFGRAGIGAGTFTDLYQFIVDEPGTGSGSVTTTTSFLLSSSDVDFTNIWVNGIVVPITSIGSFFETAGIFGVPITAGVFNTIQINYVARGDGSYGGNATFVPNSAVPEPATWAMMLFGFGAIGFGMRRRRKETARVRFAF